MKICPECNSRTFPRFKRSNDQQIFNVSCEYKCECGWSEKVEFPFTMRHPTANPATETQTESQSE